MKYNISEILVPILVIVGLLLMFGTITYICWKFSVVLGLFVTGMIMLCFGMAIIEESKK